MEEKWEQEIERLKKHIEEIDKRLKETEWIVNKLEDTIEHVKHGPLWCYF